MIGLFEAFEAHHGVLSAAELRAIGVTRRRIDEAVRRGTVLRPRHGWYCRSDHELSDVGIAKLMGGALTCVSALVRYGVWVPEAPTRRHVRLSRSLAADWPTSPLNARLGPSVHVHRHSDSWRLRADGALDPPLMALLAAERCVQPIELVAIIDSMRHVGVPLHEIELAASMGTAGLRTALGRSRISESGAESIVRERLRSAGITTRTQVWAGRWRLDLVIGEWLVIEVDGFAYHRDRRPFDRDRLRDRELALAGYTVLRLTTVDVWHRWDDVLEQIRAAMVAGWHRRPRRGAVACA